MKKIFILLSFSSLLLGGCASTQSYTSAGSGVYYAKPAVNVGVSYGMGWYSYPWSLSYGGFPSYGYSFGYSYGYGYGHGWGGLHGIHYGRFSPYWGYPLYYANRPHLYGPYLHSNYYGQARQHASNKGEHKSDHKKRKHKKKKNPVRVVTLPGSRYGRIVGSNRVANGGSRSPVSAGASQKSKAPPPSRIQPVDGAVVGISPTVTIIRRELQPEDAAYSVFNSQSSAAGHRSASGVGFSKAGNDPVQRLHGNNAKLINSRPIQLPGGSSEGSYLVPHSSSQKSKPARPHKAKANYRGAKSSGRHKGRSKGRSTSGRSHSSGRPSH